MTKPFVHIEDWIEDTSNDSYARFMFNHFRLRAALVFDFNPFVKPRKLFGTYQGERFRITGASSMGDVWLNPDFEQEHGYKHRVCITEVTELGPKP